MMDSAERRGLILEILRTAQGPISATALAKMLSVSRQVVVGDVALLRAGGATVAATPRGYLLPRDSGGAACTVVCRHTAQEMERELCMVVDQGCTVVDVIVEHPVYGQITGDLHLSSRFDVRQFVEKTALAGAKPLSALTGGIHLHTLRGQDQSTLDRAVAALDGAGFLLRDGAEEPPP